MAEVRDYNGVGDWSVAAIQTRYRYLAKKLRLSPRTLQPREHAKGDTRWIYPLMEEVVAGIKEGDGACVELGVQFIESGPPQPFGRALHSNTARALRRAALNADQVLRLRSRILGMLSRSQVPREYGDYAKLLRSIGLGEDWLRTRAIVDEGHPHVMEHVRYFEAVLSRHPAVQQGLGRDNARRCGPSPSSRASR
jgi:hypothetical protein